MFICSHFSPLGSFYLHEVPSSGKCWDVQPFYIAPNWPSCIKKKMECKCDANATECECTEVYVPIPCDQNVCAAKSGEPFCDCGDSSNRIPIPESGNCSDLGSNCWNDRVTCDCEDPVGCSCALSGARDVGLMND